MARTAATAVLSCVLLSLVNTHQPSCPAGCHCTFSPPLNIYSCALGNSTGGALLKIYIVKEFIYLSFDCKSTHLVCSDIAELDLPNRQIRVSVTACSVSEVLRCVGAAAAAAVGAGREVYSVKVHAADAPWAGEDVRALHAVGQVELNLTATDSPIPVAAINSWSSLKHLYIWRESPRSSQASHHDHDVTTLHANSFIGLTSLISLYIIDNNIEVISEGAFKGLNALEKLNLINNKVQCIAAGTFANTPHLRSLILSMVMLKTLPDRLLQPMQQLEEIWLISNKVNMSLGSRAFQHLPALKYIDISSSKISSLQENVFIGCNCLDILKMNNNMIMTLPLKIFWSLPSLKQLALSHNELTELTENIFSRLYQLERLDLSNNHLESLPKSLFSDLSNLTHLDISNNKFVSITWKIVYDPRKIQLTYNWYEMVVSQQQDSPFKLLTNLRVLHLAGNQISKLHERWLTHFRHLHLVNFSRNSFSDIQDISNADYTNVNMTIDLSYNHIRYVHLPSRLPFVEDERPATTTVILTGDPVQCDWHNYGLHRRLNGARQPGEPAYVLADRCQSPSNMKGQFLKDISPELLICDLSEHCPVACVCIGTIKDISIHCADMPAYEDFHIYTLLKRDISLCLDNAPESIEGFKIHKLNVSNVGLTNVTFSPVESLKILDVSGNKLSTIPVAFLKANITIYLSNNSLECDCSFAKDIASLHEYGLVPDYDQVSCSNGDTIARVNRQCNNEGISISGIGYSVFGALILFIAAFKLFLRSDDVRLYIMKVFCRRKYEEQQYESMEMILDADKQYDIFISYAEEDEVFVHENLMTKLTDEFNQKVCERAWGLTDRNLITDQIIDSVEASRRTMLILTERLLAFEWSYLEFRTAYNLHLQDGRPTVIVVVLTEEVLNDERMCEELKAYISANSYLLWGAHDLWEKLQKNLPRKGRKVSCSRK